ncbi:MAG: carbamoyltransferase HypF [Armatimonadetes bacterium]|nr:carbamoyltransferase HypF [Armatimonadota bacterium]
MKSETKLIRRIVRVTGVVQGVGFRPFVCRLARNHSLRGWVRNSSSSVEIDVEGPASGIEEFVCCLTRQAPELARVTSLTTIEADPVGYGEFRILESEKSAEVQVGIPSDVASCKDCLREIFDPDDRRFGYEFTNCTSCGPRFTIVRRVPYDRSNTTMSEFEMCSDCAAEYRNPANRRFHAEPIACPKCGPRVWIEVDGRRIDDTPLRLAGELLWQGRIVAIKGLGGFHLACDARNPDAVRTLRVRKGRVAKPFALMLKDIEEAEKVCELTAAARDLLISSRRPIVLARKRAANGMTYGAKFNRSISQEVAPSNRNLGLMLPYTPLHVLLFQHAPPALVMTSGNLSEEPLVFTNGLARERLAVLADAFLMHDRDIHVPCDDSVIRADDPCGAIIIRRARGFVPDAIDLVESAAPSEPILGVGAEQKNTFCLGLGSQAVVSQHIGDLDTVETFDYFRYAVDHFMSLFRVEPTTIAHDLHPDYLSTRFAHDKDSARLVGVQHHHAHIASCLVENGRNERCIGVALDGTGWGMDGTVWGGEILVADLEGFERVGSLAPIRMPGGEAAIRDPSRMAAAYLHTAYGQDFKHVAEKLGLELTDFEYRVIRRQIETGLNSPVTSSAGRLFDALSAAIGVCRERTYEGQPAVELEMIADERETGSYTSRLTTTDGIFYLDPVPVFKAAVDEFIASGDKSVVSARFHNSLVEMLAKACERVRETTRLQLVALSGGVFQNAIILWRLKTRLEEAGFEVLIHRLIPPNDACISLGQVVVAANRTVS